MSLALQHSIRPVLLISLWFLTITSVGFALPLKGKNLEDVRKDIQGYPVWFSLKDKNQKIRFQVLSKGKLIATQAVGGSKAHSEIIVVLITEKEWQLQTYKKISKAVLRFLPIETKSGTVLRVWTSSEAYFDIDLDFNGKLEFAD